VKNFWRTYFSFTKGDQNAFLVMLILLLLIVFAPLAYDLFFMKEKKLDYSAFRKEILAFEMAQEKKKNERRAERTTPRRDFNYYEIDKSVRASQLTPFPFNPNNLPVKEWQKMGLSDRQIRGIKNFEAAGGRFLIKEDFNKLFVISDEEYKVLAPYIQLPEQRKPASRPDITLKEPEIHMVEINSADSLNLRKIRGIGPVLSRRIISYRERLGGFYKKEQLLEVFGIDSALYQSISPYIDIDPSHIQKININKARIYELQKHPYINRNKAMSLVNIRNVHGNYQSVADIMQSMLIDDESFYKIAPYLAIE